MIRLCKNIRVRMHAHTYVGLYMYDVCACIWLLMFVYAKGFELGLHCARGCLGPVRFQAIRR